MTIAPLDLGDIRIELDLSLRNNLILNHSGEYGLAGWRDIFDPADRSDITDVNDKNGTLSVQTDVDGPYFRGIPVANTPAFGKYRTNYMPVKPWQGMRTFTFGVQVASPIGGANHVIVYMKLLNSSMVQIAQPSVSQSITPGAAYTEVRGTYEVSSSAGVAFVELIISNDTVSPAGKQLNFKKATVFSVPGGEDPSGVVFPADTWTDVSSYMLADSSIRRGNSLDAANESIETGFMSLYLAGETYAPNTNKEVRPGLRGRWSIWDGTQWRTRFVGEMYAGEVKPRLDGTGDRTVTMLNFRDNGAYLKSSPAAVLLNGSYRQRVAQALGRRIPFYSTDPAEGQINSVNKREITVDDNLTKADALGIIRNTYVAIRDAGDMWLDRSGHLHCYNGEDEYVSRKPYLFATRAPVISSNMAESDVRTNQYSKPSAFTIVQWQLATPTTTLIPVSSDLGNDQKAWAALDETLTCQVRVIAQQNIRFIPQVVTNTTTISGTPVDIEAGEERHFIWSRVFDADDAANGIKFQLKFEEYGGGAFTITGNYAQVYDPLVMVGTWSEPEQYFDGSSTFASWIDKPTQAGSQGSFKGGWSVRDLQAPNMGIVNDGLDLTFDTTAVVNRLKVVHKGLGADEAHGPFFNRASLNEWGDSSSEYPMNDKGPATAASYIFGRMAQPKTFPTRIVWNASDSLDKLGTFDINDIFGVLHNDTVIDCKVLYLTETIRYYDNGTKAKYMVEITPKPYSVGLEAGDVEVGPAEEQYVGGVADTPLADLNIYTNPPVAVLRQTSAQSIPNATFTSLNFNAEDIDTANGHSTSSLTSRYTCQKDGKYLFLGSASTAANVTGGRTMRWTKNGTAINGSQAPGYSPSVTSSYMAKPVLVDMVIGDYVELQMYQSSGGALNTQVTTDLQPNMTVTYQSP